MNPNSKINTVLTYGGIMISIAVFITFIYFFKGNLHQSAAGSFHFMILLFGISVFTRRYRDKHLQRQITFNEAFNFGFQLTLIFSGVLALMYFILYKTNPQLFNEYIYMAKEMSKQFSFPIDINSIRPFHISLGLFIWHIIIGTLFTLLNSFIVKRLPTPFKKDNSDTNE